MTSDGASVAQSTHERASRAHNAARQVLLQLGRMLDVDVDLATPFGEEPGHGETYGAIKTLLIDAGMWDDQSDSLRPPSPPPSVKSLQWKVDGKLSNAESSIGWYKVEDQGPNWVADRYWVMFSSEIIGKFEQIEQAHAYAQADFHMRITSSLSEVGSNELDSFEFKGKTYYRKPLASSKRTAGRGARIRVSSAPSIAPYDVEYPSDRRTLLSRLFLAEERARRALAALSSQLTMQDVRLHAGEGKLRTTDVLASVNCELANRARHIGLL